MILCQEEISKRAKSILRPFSDPQRRFRLLGIQSIMEQPLTALEAILASILVFEKNKCTLVEESAQTSNLFILARYVFNPPREKQSDIKNILFSFTATREVVRILCLYIAIVRKQKIFAHQNSFLENFKSCEFSDKKSELSELSENSKLSEKSKLSENS